MTNIRQHLLVVRDAVVRGYRWSWYIQERRYCSTEESIFAYSGSGTATFSGENFFSQGHKVQSSVLVIQLLHLVVQMNHSSLQCCNTVLFDISGTGAESRKYYQLQGKHLSDLLVLYLVSNLLLVLMNRTVLFDVSGGATDVQVAKEMEMSISSTLLGRCNRASLYTLLLGYHLLEISQQNYTIGVLLLPLLLNLQRIGVLSIQTTRLIPKEAENWGFLLPDFNYVQIGGQHYPNLDSLSEQIHHLPDRLLDITGIATFLLSEDLSIASAISIRVFWYHWYCHLQGWNQHLRCKLVQSAVQHTVFGEEGEFTISGTGSESITPATEIGSGSLFTIGGIAESTTKAYLVGDYQFIFW